ncbi:STAS domain-containing protein [Hymenobacter caeli]|uniref:MlaB-like STAS domain-containing protein n=1 Tax=Hymenobacter caeli TaxID=2735894 RepID=A0ABX2FN10_9BACT|nr:STAS domain-containing protein [Hymenobacter caeli]NRT18552.1 hypothetical protein [Hymenobacter caeli]
MRVYQELLPHSCLLILTDNDGWAGSAPLAKALRWALRHHHRRVWVDCTSVAHLSATVLALLQQGAERLRQRGGCLVLCHPPRSFGDPNDERVPASLVVAASLLDAENVNMQFE